MSETDSDWESDPGRTRPAGERAPVGELALLRSHEAHLFSDLVCIQNDLPLAWIREACVQDFFYHQPDHSLFDTEYTLQWFILSAKLLKLFCYVPRLR